MPEFASASPIVLYRDIVPTGLAVRRTAPALGLRQLSVVLGLGLAVMGCDDPTPDDTGPPDIDTNDLPDQPDDGLDERAGTELLESGVVTCADPEARQEQLYDYMVINAIKPPKRYLASVGSTVADFNGDGVLDVAFATQERVQLLEQDPKTGLFNSRLLYQASAGTEVRGLFGLVAIDYDDDGDMDLHVTGYGMRDALLRNDGKGAFGDVAPLLGIAGSPLHHSSSATWVDWDGDGDLDVFVGGHGWVDESKQAADLLPAEQSYMWRNEGDGTFTDISSVLSEELHQGYTFISGFFDADGDGDLDMYMVNDFGGALVPCKLVYNDGNDVWRADNNATYVDAEIAGMGLAIGDVDNDGIEDFSVPAWNVNHLYNYSQEYWFNIASARGVQPLASSDQTVGWGAELVDVNNDTRMDLAVQYGRLDTNIGSNNGLTQWDAVWVQQPDGTFVDLAPEMNMDNGASHRGAVWADLNRDGYLDQVKLGMDGKGRVGLSRCGSGGWLTVQFDQPAPNIHGIGAVVIAEIGDTKVMRRLRAGGTGYGTGGPPELHLGLGAADLVDRLTIQWPDGAEDVFYDVSTRQHLTVRREVRPDATADQPAK